MKKIKIILIFMLLIALVSPITNIVLAGDIENPEIEDELNDTDLPFLDIESAWFYENIDEPEYLYTALKLKSLNIKENTVLSIRWNYNEKDYISGFNSFKFRGHVFRSGDPKRATYWQWNTMPKCEGYIDQDNNIITWKILKSNIGNPKKDEVLMNTRAAAVPGFPTSFIYFFLGLDFRDFAPNEQYTYGLNYVIQYNE
jgi:hypothetical protein